MHRGQLKALPKLRQECDKLPSCAKQGCWQNEELRPRRHGGRRCLAQSEASAGFTHRILRIGDKMKASVIYQEILQEGKQFGFVEREQKGQQAGKKAGLAEELV
jgi:hypothetical protein